MLRKNFESSDFLKIPRRTFQAFGMQIDVKLGEKFWPLKTAIFILFCFLIGVFTAIMSIVHVVKHRNDMIEVVQGLRLFLPWLLGTLKSTVFLWKRQKNRQMIKRLETMANEANILDKEYYRRENSPVISIANLYYNLAFSFMFLLISLPGILMLKNYYLGREFVLEPPYKGMHYLYDLHNWQNYALYAISFFFFLCTMTVTAIPVDTLLLWFVNFLSAMYHVLYGKLKDLAETIGSERERSMFFLKLKNVIAYHTLLISLIKEFNDLYSMIMLFEMLGSCFQMCMFIYQVKAGPELHQLPIIFVAVFGMLLQVSIYCFGGQKLQNMSEMLSDSIYMLFPWHQMTPNEKCCMLLPLMSAQRSFYLKAHFFHINARLLLTVRHANENDFKQ